MRIEAEIFAPGTEYYMHNGRGHGWTRLAWFLNQAMGPEAGVYPTRMTVGTVGVGLCGAQEQ